MVKNKRGQESNVIIFIILALIVGGLVVWFTYGFFSKGTSLLDMNDIITQSAIQSCQIQINMNPTAGYCNTPMNVKMADGKTRIVNCKFIRESLKSNLINFTGVNYGNDGCNDDNFIKAECRRLNLSDMGESAVNKTKINNMECSSANWTTK